MKSSSKKVTEADIVNASLAFSFTDANDVLTLKELYPLMS